ncbi:hypothetical protein ABFX02_14G105800 [Erythranthe guttata]
MCPLILLFWFVLFYAEKPLSHNLNQNLVSSPTKPCSGFNKEPL